MGYQQTLSLCFRENCQEICPSRKTQIAKKSLSCPDKHKSRIGYTKSKSARSTSKDHKVEKVDIINPQEGQIKRQISKAKRVPNLKVSGYTECQNLNCIYLKMAAWPEFEFESEFESASEYSTPTSESSSVPIYQVTLSLLRNHNTQTYQSNVQSHNGDRSKPPVAEQSQPPAANGVQIQPPDPHPEPDLSQPERKQLPKGGIQVQPERKQPPAPSQNQNQSQRQPLVLKRQPLMLQQFQRQPQDGILFQNQPPAAKSKPPDVGQPPDKRQPLNPSQRPKGDERQPPVAAKSQPQARPLDRRISQVQPLKQPQEVVKNVNWPLNAGIQCQSQPLGLPPDPDPKSSVSKEDWGKGSIDPG